MLKFSFKRANETVMSQKDLFVFSKCRDVPKKNVSRFSLSIKQRITHRKGQISTKLIKTNKYNTKIKNA